MSLSFCALVCYTKIEVIFTTGVVNIFVMIIGDCEPCHRPAECVVQCMEKMSIIFGELAILTVFPTAERHQKCEDAFLKLLICVGVRA